EIVYIPSRVAVFGEFAAFSLLNEFELAFVQARGMGPRDENDQSIYTDHFEASLAGTYFLGSGLGAKLGVAHRTLSYANNAYVSLDTMPVTSVRALMILGDKDAHAHLGLLYGFGKDGQS